MRDGTPLPGRTPGQVLSQLAHRVFGPLQPARTRIVLDYHGLLDHPAGPLAQIAGRYRVTTRTVSNNVSAVRIAGTRLPLSASLIVQATRASVPGDDHLARVRIAGSLGLPAPAAAAVQDPTPVAAAVPAGHLAVARAAARMLAGAGPLDLPTLAAAITPTRRFRSRNPLSHSDLVAALTAVGCILGPADRWYPPAGVVAPERYRVIVTLAAGRDLSRAEMIDIFLAAGYRESSATGRMSSSHPLFRHTGPDRYRLIGDAQPGGSIGHGGGWI
jgi:hypothetical protein